MLKDAEKVYLEKKAAEYAEPVRKLIAEGMVLFGKEPDISPDVYDSVTYKNAQTAIMLWLKCVWAMDIAELHDHTDVRIVLYFPLGDMTMDGHNTYSFYPGFCNENSFLVEDSFKQFTANENIRLPIGKMDLFTYEAITQIKGNPVELFYCYLSSMLKKMHSYKGCEGVLSEECLKKNGIQDPYKVYKMDFLLRDIDQFFSG